MINLDANGRLTKWFVWSVDHLPFTAGSYKVEDEERYRTGEHYITNGTTLCHIFWATLWMPLITVAFLGLLATLVVMMHVLPGLDFAQKHPDFSPAAQIAMYFLPEWVALLLAVVVGTIILAIMGGSKTGFFALLWSYLKGIKQRICPIVHFDGSQMQAAE